MPFRGGLAFHLPVGTFYARNITPDLATGIGKRTDREAARILRHGVGHDGRAVLPFMPFANLSDEDLTAVISYLRSRPAVAHQVPAHDFNFLGRAVKAFLLRPEGPSGPVAASLPPAPTAEYGRYLANSVANCAGCHTKRDPRTGKSIGIAFAGGMEIPSHAVEGLNLVSPDVRGDARGQVATLDEDAFVARFRRGRVIPGSPMPWESFSRMTEDDLRALHRYLRSLGDSARAPGVVAQAEVSR